MIYTLVRNPVGFGTASYSLEEDIMGISGGGFSAFYCVMLCRNRYFDEDAAGLSSGPYIKEKP
jgi:hypothetical protein